MLNSVQMIDDYIRVAPEPGSAEDVWNLVARFEDHTLSVCVIIGLLTVLLQKRLSQSWHPFSLVV